VEDVQVGDHHVAQRSGQREDLDRYTVDLSRRSDQRPAMIWPAGAVEQAGQPRVMAHEGPPVFRADAGGCRQAFPVAVNQAVRARQQHGAAPARADLADEPEQLDRSHRPGGLLETAVHVPGIGQHPGTRPGEGEQDLGTRPGRLPASGSEDLVQRIAHWLVVCERPEHGVTPEALPVQGGRTRPAGGVAGAEPGLAFGVTPHRLPHGRCRLRGERAGEADDAGGLEARSDTGRFPWRQHAQCRYLGATR
jgi:hypothetical protein